MKKENVFYLILLGGVIYVAFNVDVWGKIKDGFKKEIAKPFNIDLDNYIYQVRFRSYWINHDKKYAAKSVNFNDQGDKSRFGKYKVWYFYNDKNDTWQYIPNRRYNSFSFIKKYGLEVLE